MASTPGSIAQRYFPDNGEMSRFIKNYNWAETLLGPISQWPQALVNTTILCLESRSPIIIYCTGNYLMLYNDAMAGILGQKHPQALGKRAEEVFPEIQNVISPMLDQVFQTGEAVYVENKLLNLNRNGTAKPAYFNFTFNPIRDEQGNIIGIFNIAAEMTSYKKLEMNLEAAKAEVEAEKEQLERIFNNAPSFMCLLDGPDYIVDRVNDQLPELLGERDIIGKPIREAIPELDEQGFPDLLDEVYQTGKPYIGNDIPILFERPGTADQPVKLYLNLVCKPFCDSKGNITGVFVQAVNLTRRKKAEKDLLRITTESEQQKRLYETIVSNTPDLIFIFDNQYRFIFANDALLNMWDRSLEDSVGKNLIELGYEPWHAEMHERELDQIVATKLPIRGEIPFNHASLGRRVYEYIFVPVLDASGEVEAVAGTARDITFHKQAEEKQNTLIAELNHRVKNMLSTIQSIAQQTLQKSSSQEEFVSRFTGRLHALGRAHRLLAQSNWDGAFMDDILSEQLAICSADDRISCSGPSISFSPQMSLYLALILHELGTNAYMHGALSVPHGKLAVSWQVVSSDNGPVMKLIWVEANGPAVVSPVQQGFGMILIQKSLGSFNGEVNLLFNPEGVRCEIHLPLPGEAGM